MTTILRFQDVKDMDKYIDKLYAKCKTCNIPEQSKSNLLKLIDYHSCNKKELRTLLPTEMLSRSQIQKSSLSSNLNLEE